MPRPQGSKNKKTMSMEKELEIMQKRINDLEKISNSYDEVIDSFTEGFVMDLYNKDIIKRVDNDTLHRWFSSPDEYMKEINSLLTYYYIIDGNIFQLFDLIFTLPELNYKITTIEKDEKSKEDLRKIKLILEKKINHKELTRDLAIQLASKGTLIGTWLGGKNPYFYVFDDLDYIYPYGRYRGDMIAVVDLEWLNEKSDAERQHIYNSLSPLITQDKYDKYQNETDYEKKEEMRYISLPVDKTLVARIHTLTRNQRLGIPFGTQSLFDIQHKQKLKDLEIAIANKIIRAMAVLKFQGKDDNDVKVSSRDKKKVFSGVKKALEKSTKDNGIAVIAIPDFASFDFPEMKNGEKALAPEKYESVNSDLQTSTGISSVLTSGKGGNYSSASLNLSILHKKIGIILEKIEVIYNQLINLTLGNRGDNYIFEYDTQEPISKDKKLETLYKLQSEGYAIKPLIDLIGVDYDDFIEQSVYEIEDLKLREKIIPPKTSHTLTNEDAGKPRGDNAEENDDGNMQKSPSD